MRLWLACSALRRGEDWHKELALSFKIDLHAHANCHVFGGASDDVGDHAEALVLVELDDRDDVRGRHAWVKRMPIHREAEDAPSAADDAWFERVVSFCTAWRGWMNPAPAVLAPKDRQLTPGSTRPERTVVISDVGEDSGRRAITRFFVWHRLGCPARVSVGV